MLVLSPPGAPSQGLFGYPYKSTIFVYQTNNSMQQKQHPNSKRITIFRAGSFADDAQTGAVEFIAMSKKSIGSYYQSNLGAGIGTGLSFEEQDILMPLLIDIPKEDRTYRAGITTFFSGINTVISHGTGRDFEIGLTVDNNEPVTYVDKDGRKNLPININEYIRYRHAIRHPRVAMSRDDAKGNQLLEFYVFDPEQVVEALALASNVKDEAITLYLTLKEDPKKVDMMLTIMGIDPRMFSGKNAGGERLEELRFQADTRAVEFLKEHKAAHFDERYTLLSLVNTGIVKKVAPARYLTTETSTILGNNMEEALLWLIDKANSETVALLKAAMQEQLKLVVPNPKKFTKKTTAR